MDKHASKYIHHSGLLNYFISFWKTGKEKGKIHLVIGEIPMSHSTVLQTTNDFHRGQFSFYRLTPLRITQDQGSLREINK